MTVAPSGLTSAVGIAAIREAVNHIRFVAWDAELSRPLLLRVTQHVNARSLLHLQRLLLHAGCCGFSWMAALLLHGILLQLLLRGGLLRVVLVLLRLHRSVLLRLFVGRVFKHEGLGLGLGIDHAGGAA